MTDKFQVVPESSKNVQDTKSYPAVSDQSSEYVIIPPDGGWGWVVVAAAFFCQAVVDGILLTYGTYLHKIAGTYRKDLSNVSLVGSLMFGVHLAAGPICAVMMQCMFIRTIVMIGGVMMALAMAVPQMNPPFWVLAAAFGLLAGVGMCFVFMATIMMTSKYFSRRRLIALGLVVCSTGAGTILFVFAGNSMLEILSWQEAHLVLSGLSLLIVPVALAFRPLVPAKIETSKKVEIEEVLSHNSELSLEDSDEGSTTVIMLTRNRVGSEYSIIEAADEAADEVMTRFTVVPPHRAGYHRECCCYRRRKRIAVMNPTTKAQLMKDLNNNQSILGRPRSRSRRLFGRRIIKIHWKDTLIDMISFQIMRNYRFCFYCMSGCFSVSGLIIIFTYESGLMQALRHSASEATNLVATLGGANMIWRILLGWFSTVKCVDYHIVHVTGLVIGGLAMFAATATNNIKIHYFLGVLQGLAFASFAVFRPVLLLDLVGPEKLTNATGISLLFTGISSVIAPPLTGLVVHYFRDYIAVLWLAGSCYILSAILLIPTREKSNSRLRRWFCSPPSPSNV